MNIYLYSFDIAAALVSAVLVIIYALHHGFRTKTSILFLVLLHVTLVLAISDCFSKITIEVLNYKYVWLKYLLQILCLLCYLTYAACCYAYVLILTKKDGVSRFDMVLGCAMGIMLLGLSLTTPATHLIYDMSVQGEVVRGWAYPILIGFNGILFIYEFILVIKNRQNLRPIQFFAVTGGEVLMSVALLLQSSHDNVIVIPLACAIILVVIYAALEDPSEYLYNNSKCFNDKAFYVAVDKNLRNLEGKSVIVFKIDGYEYISHLLDDKLIVKFRDEVVKFFHHTFDRQSVFCLGNDIYAVITWDGESNAAERAIENFPYSFTIEDMEISAALKAIELDTRNFKSTSEVRHIIETVVSKYQEAGIQHINEQAGEMLRKRNRELKIVQAVREALKKKSFEIFYQPILEESSGKFISAEALIRLRDETGEFGGYIPPGVFIPLAERNGLIIPIGEFVFESVCRFYTENQLERKGVKYIEVNLSPVQCMQQDLTLRLQSIMRRYAINPECINLEITETAEGADKYIMQRNIKSLLNRGLSFSLDDFGTGFSNIDHLARLPVTLIKFDKSLLDDAMADENSKIILESLMTMLKGLRYKCVAEGIETEEMHQMVRAMGCDYYQGYLFSRPIPESDYLRFLQAH